MRTSKYVLSLLCLLVGWTTVFGADETRIQKAFASAPAISKTTTSRKDISGADGGKNVALTGSLLKRQVKRDGQITDAAAPVLVIDQKSIAKSGASDLRQLLTRQGVGR